MGMRLCSFDQTMVEPSMKQHNNMHGFTASPHAGYVELKLELQANNDGVPEQVPDKGAWQMSGSKTEKCDF